MKYLRHRSRKYHNFIELTNPLHELIHTRALDDVNVMKLTFDLDRYREVGLVQYLETLAYWASLKKCAHLEAAMYEGFVQVQN